ncbi:MAG: hypothetical protein ACJ72N_12775 [Labedaea sp.]
MAELMEVVADAVRAAGGRARTAVGRYPTPGPDTVYLVVPHEYFVVTPDSDLPSAELCRRTIAFGVEHPGTGTFERTAGLVGVLGGVVDISRGSTAELCRRGIPTEHFQLGYSPLWDTWGGDPDSPRPIDVTYLGTAERRRSLLLGSYAGDLDHLRTRLFTPPHEMMAGTRVDFLPGAAKLSHLARSRFLLNLHRERKQALEWVRVLEAMCNGCVVVSEPSLEVEPLVPGEHLVVARPESLGAVTAALCAEPGRERDLRAAAYELARGLDLVGSARMLVEMAGGLVSGAAPAPPETFAAARAMASAVRSADGAMAVDTPSWDVRFAGERSLGDPPTAHGVAAAARLVGYAATARRRTAVWWEPACASSPFPDADRADVDVLLVHRPGELDPAGLVNDLVTGTVLPRRVLVGADGVPSGSVPPWCDVLHQDSPLGRGLTRNALLRRTEAPWLLVLDTGLSASPHLLERLVGAAKDVDVVHCPVADPVDGLVGALPPEERRLRLVPYLGSGYLVRRSLLELLGGWSEDSLLEGLADHAFWRLVAAGGYETALVQQVLLRRVRPEPEPRPVDLDPHRVWAHANSASPVSPVSRSPARCDATM